MVKFVALQRFDHSSQTLVVLYTMQENAVGIPI